MSSDLTPTAVIIGASSGVGAALAKILFEKGYSLVLSSRSERDLLAIAGNLQIRNLVQGPKVHVRPIHLNEAKSEAKAFCEDCVKLLGKVDTLFVTAGQIDERDVGYGEASLIDNLMNVNAIGPIQMIAEFMFYFESINQGTVVAFSSIAAAVPRGRNVIYAASKSALEAYCLGLRHFFSSTPICIQVIALGYVATSMTFGKKLLFPVVSAETAAKFIVKNLTSGSGKFYFPKFWRIIVDLLNLLPWFIYRRLKF